MSTEVRTRSNNNGYHGSLNPFYRIESQVYRKATRVKDKKKPVPVGDHSTKLDSM